MSPIEDTWILLFLSAIHWVTCSFTKITKVKSDHLHFIIIATQSTVPLSYSLIYIGCVKRLLCKFVRNHSLIQYSLHCDWLLPSTDLKGHSRLRWLCKPINVPKSLQAVLLPLDIMFTLIIWHVSRKNDEVSDTYILFYERIEHLISLMNA